MNYRLPPIASKVGKGKKRNDDWVVNAVLAVMSRFNTVDIDTILDMPIPRFLVILDRIIKEDEEMKKKG